MRAMLPELRGLKVVDLGCGFGWFCRWAREQGVAFVLGLDVSENMLSRARSATADAAITYEQADLERLSLPEAMFDLAYSSLALHYIQDIAGVFTALHRALVPGGHLIFSIEHPIYMAPRDPEWTLDPQGYKIWPLSQYSVEGPRTTNWLAEGVIKQHRTIGTTLNHLIRCGFTVAHVEEWAPTDEQIAARPELSEERERPMFLLVAARRG